MKYSAILPLFVCLSSLGFVFTAEGDTVLLENGDRLTGDIVRIGEGVLQLETPYAGSLEIDLSGVAEVDGTQDLVLKRENGALLEGRLESREGEQGVLAGDEWYPVALPEVTLAIPDAAPEEEEAAEATTDQEVPQRWSGSIESGLSMRSGNTDTTDYTFNTTLERAGNQDVLTLKFEAAYGEARDVINTRRYRGSATWQFYPREKLFWYSSATAEQDDGRKLDYRAVAGLGMGYDFIDTEDRSLSADIGLNYTWEQWAPYTPAEADAARVSQRASAQADLLGAMQDITNNDFTFNLENIRYVYGRYRDFRNPLRHAVERKEDYSNLRIGADFSQSLLRSSTLTDSMVLYGNLGDFGEFRMENELAFITALSEALSLKVSLKSEYDSQAEDSNVESWDHLLVTTLGYSF